MKTINLLAVVLLIAVGQSGVATAITITSNSPLPSGSVGQYYNQIICSVDGGAQPYTWGLVSGTLPPNLSLYGGNLIASLSGTLTVATTAIFAVQARDYYGQTATATFSLTVYPPATPFILTTSPLPDGKVGAAYSQAFTGQGGSPPYTWSLASGSLPAGLALSSAGQITGTPSVATTSSFTVRLTDAKGASATGVFSLTIAPVPPVITTSSPLPTGIVGTAYSQTLSATGGTTPYTWSVVSNSLPSGLSLSTAGVISGTPIAANTVQFQVQVASTGGLSSTDLFTLTIKMPPVNVLYTFTNFAGTPGYVGDVDGAGSGATFYYPSGVAVDSAGNLYVADSGNHTIRKMSATGVVTTLAGSAGVSGSADGTGSAARFKGPSGVAVDSAGNVYVADESNHTIRKVTATGVVTTLAGSAGLSGSTDGTGSAVRFNYPRGVAVDSAGNVYVADMLNDTIRKVTPLGVVTTLAGSAGVSGSADGTGSAARFYIPVSVAVDSNGNIYVSDQRNCTIRKVTAGGVVTTLAGSAGLAGGADGTGSAARFNYPDDVAVDSAGNVYVADYVNATIRKVTPSGVVTTLAGSREAYGYADGTGGAARFNGPSGMAVDSAGNVYVTDSPYHLIRKVTATGAVTTLAGNAGISGSGDGTGGAPRFNSPRGVTVDIVGNVYVADSQNETIRKVSAMGVVTTLAGSAGISGSADGTGSEARFNYPTGVAVDSAGNVYVADSQNETIRKVSATGVVTTLAGSAGVAGSADGTGSTARFNYPRGVAADSAGNVYVADMSNHTIRKVTVGGVVTTLAGSTGVSGSFDGTSSGARFNNPAGMAVDNDGNVYVADSGNHTIRKLTEGLVTTIGGSAGVSGSADGTGSAARFYNPTGVAVDGAGNVFVADQDNKRISKGVPSTVTPTVATPTITPNGGSFVTSVQVSLSCATSGATTRYTTDGTDPTGISPVYSAPFMLDSSVTVKACGFKTGLSNSAVATASFIITCGYSLTAGGMSFGADGGNAAVGVTAGNGCSWMATSDVDWITVTVGASGIGNGSVSYLVQTNATGSNRNGTLTIAGNTYTVNQAIYAVSPPSVVTNAVGDVNGVPVVLPEQPISFSNTVTNPGGVPLSCFWDFGDGVASVDCQPSHVFSNCGPHMVTNVVTDGVLPVTNTLLVAVACPLDVRRLNINMKFLPGKLDTGTLTGFVQLPVGYNVTNLAAQLEIGGVAVPVTLSPKGLGLNGYSRLKMQHKGKLTNLVWQVTGKLKGDFDSLWANNGLTNATVKSVPITMPVLLLLDSDPPEAFSAGRSLLYNATAGKSGTAK